MRGQNECPKCRGKGFAPIARGIATCRFDIRAVAILDQRVTAEEAERMVGG